MTPRAILPALLTLAACTAPQGDYPSLLPRPIESLSFAEPARPVPVVTADAALDRRIAALDTAVGDAMRGFDATVDRARPAIRAAARTAPGSEPWLGAQVALAQLDVARTTIDAPVADLERMAIDRAAAGRPPYPALDEAVARATQAATAQRATIATLSGMLR